ncbi:MAG: tripartite tricarboxylate transporter permease [Lentisphaerae bacterium]|nr:tripartite tricarboxylate transporter permease [Lentisphaerota bacterium]
MTIVYVVLSTVVGTFFASLLACVPSLHIYNVMGLLVMLGHALISQGIELQPEIVIPFAASLMVGYAMLNTLPSVLLAAPDESAMFTVLPGQKFLMQGRGYEAVIMTTVGGMIGLMALLFIVAPLAPRLLPLFGRVFRGHTHWILWTVIAFMLMSEWPKGGRLGRSGWAKFIDSWKTTGAGLLTFLLSGLLGFVLIFRTPIAADVAFQNLMPAFVGLFAVPWLVLNIATNVTVPEQTMEIETHLRLDDILRGGFAGTLGGGFAAYFPVVTGGVGGLLAGHATALRNDRVFLVSQGASKLVYYVGGLMLFFVPGVHLKRGGGAALMRSIMTPRTDYEYYLMLAAMAGAGVISILLVSPLTRGMLWLIGKVGYRRLSSLALLLIVGLVVGITGLTGLAVMAVGTGIGLMPVLYGSRRMNCLGVIMLPMACNMSGIGPTVAGWLGLL